MATETRRPHVREHNPIRVNWVDPAKIPAGAGWTGRLGMTFLPGKHERGQAGNHWRDLDQDVERLASTLGVDTFVLLVEDHELKRTGTAQIADTMAAHGIDLHRFPIVDGDVPPDLAAFAKLLIQIEDRLRDGSHVAVACRGGLGRTGTTVGCLLRDAGLSGDAAIALTRASRRGTIERDSGSVRSGLDWYGARRLMRIRTRAVTLIVSAVLVLGLAACGSASPSAQDGRLTSSEAGPATATASARPAASTATPTSIPGGEPATVIRVVDGDTIHARLNGVDEKVRIIGLDSPETNKPNTPVECFAREATAAAKRLLKPGDPILLQPDPTQDKRDRYDRLLAHVFLADGTLFAETMIRQGDAIHYVYDGVPSIHADRLAAAEAAAKASQVGLWSPTTCHGDAHEAASAP